jgi:flavin reductase (DIM6/NTAB) family NADH-FMN oxidoreductase RutF
VIDSEKFKRVMRRHAASVVIIATKVDTRVHCMTATSFTSVSVTPPLVLFCVHQHNDTHQHLASTERVGISLLASGQEAISNRFASKGPERYALDDFSFVESPAGVPLVPGSCTHFEVVLVGRHWGGDHSIFVGEVSWADVLHEVSPLVYHSGKYPSLVERAG